MFLSRFFATGLACAASAPVAPSCMPRVEPGLKPYQPNLGSVEDLPTVNHRFASSWSPKLGTLMRVFQTGARSTLTF